VTTTDEDLWARVNRGDGDAFGDVFDRHRPRVHRHAVGLSPATADADDVVAVVFLEAWRKRDAIRFVDGSMLPWLLRTATYTASNLRRASRRYREALERLPPPEPSATDALSDEDADIFTALKQLSSADQEIITLCVLEELPTADVARVLRARPGTIRTRLTRAKARLRDRLESLSPPLATEEAAHA
jgi:RNA polymerase sigma factor (sigma-70 family)